MWYDVPFHRTGTVGPLTFMFQSTDGRSFANRLKSAFSATEVTTQVSLPKPLSKSSLAGRTRMCVSRSAFNGGPDSASHADGGSTGDSMSPHSWTLPRNASWGTPSSGNRGGVSWATGRPRFRIVIGSRVEFT